jgi:ribosomal protein S27AE
VKELESWILKGLKTAFSKEKYIFYYLQANWQEIAGQITAKHSKPVRLIGEVLTINTDNAAWSNNLMMLKRQLLGKINSFIPVEAGRKHSYKIKDIRFFTGSLPPDYVIEKEEATPFIPHLDPNRRCPKCGVMLMPGEKMCGKCERAELALTREKIHKILCITPWLQHSDCIKQVNCDKMVFSDVKASLLEYAIWQAIKKDASPAEKIFPVMLERSLTPEEITEEIIKKALARYKRSRIYVSPSRKQLHNKQK